MYYRWWGKRKILGVALAAGALCIGRATPVHADAKGCEIAIATETSNFEQSKLKLLQKCDLLKRKGKLDATTDCHAETKTAAAITKAAGKLQAAITKACTGVTLTQIGWGGTGTSGNPVLAKACGGSGQSFGAGERSGEACTRETECPGQCKGGSKEDESCTFNSSCGNRRCDRAKCNGGSQDGQSCGDVNNPIADPAAGSNADLKTQCLNGGGTCNFLEECDGGSAGALGTCNGGTKNQGTCSANSDCPGGFCDAGCNTGSLLDCVAGTCEGALCNPANGNKDCKLCAGGPNINQSCGSDADCGIECVGGSNPGTPCKGTCSNDASKLCVKDSDCGVGNSCTTTSTDCLGGGTCATDPSNGNCGAGTCNSNGFCAAGSTAHARSEVTTGVGLCQPIDRCPNFENNKLNSVKTCDGGAHNGQSCTSDTFCAPTCVGGTGDCTTSAGKQACTDSGGSCTGFCNTGCGFALSTPADVTNCVTCIAEASVDQINSTTYGELTAASFVCSGGSNAGVACQPTNAGADCPDGKCKANVNDKTLEACRQGVMQAATDFFTAKRKALAKCEAGVLKAGTGACPDQKATDAITKATTKLSATVGKSCAKAEAAFGGTVVADALGQLFNCANLTPPGATTSCAGASGRGQLANVDDVAACIQCVAEFKADCSDRLTTPTHGALPSECNPLCGNGKVDGQCKNLTTPGSSSNTICGSTLDCLTGETCIPIETCDDGNTVSGDSCPANCFVNSCTAAGSQTLALSFSAPIGAQLAAASVYIEYPDGTVNIPGQGTLTDTTRLTVPFGAFSSINDLDYAVRISLVSQGDPFPGVAAVVQLDNCCTNAPTCTQHTAATNDQFRCSVESASDANGTPIPGVQCEVTVF